MLSINNARNDEGGSNMLAERLRSGGKVIGTMIRVCRNPAIANIAKDAELDFIMADMEHGSYSLRELSDIFVVARALDLGAFVRVPELARGYISRVLDLGANGVMVPMLETVEQARQFAEWAKYTPVGNRGMSACGGHTGYHKETDMRGMMERLNKETLTIAQIETEKGVEAAADIASIEGIDVLLIGPNDLSISLSCPGDICSEQVQQAILKVAQACKEHGKIFGIHGNLTLLKKWSSHGLSFIMNSMDLEILAKGMRSVYEGCRGIV
jgi:2-keto-3-deoxy-L-rhamnonate aldolase RhmA